MESQDKGEIKGEGSKPEVKVEVNTEENHLESISYDRPQIDVSQISSLVTQIKSEVNKSVIGQGELIELMMAALFSNGHVLLEGLPGVAKTMISKLIAKTISADFSRIQFTPDLMPTDITGTSVFNMKSAEFEFKKGPIFSNLVLIDEINRAPAKTQAALMEVMEEKQLTYDGKTFKFEPPFFVVATQNPIEQEGTYSLPEAQLDRFIFRIKLDYPTLEQESQILQMFENDFELRKNAEVKSVLSKEKLRELTSIIEKVYIKKDLIDYIAKIVCQTRNSSDLFLGASPRASISILRTSKALAAIRNRDFVTPDDIKTVCYPVLNHRVILSHEREMEGISIEEVIKGIINDVEVPR